MDARQLDLWRDQHQGAGVHLVFARVRAVGADARRAPMTRQQANHARIMFECGCSIEDVAITLRVTLDVAIYAVAPSLAANPREQKRVQRILRSMKLSPPIPAIHRRTVWPDLVESVHDDARIAA